MRRQKILTEFLWLGLLIALFWGGVGVPSIVDAAGFSAFGPRVYLRESGKPITEVDHFNSPSSGEYTLMIYNGGLEDDAYELVSASVVFLNGIKVLSPNELNQKIEYIEKTVTLNNSNEITVEVRGKPGGALVIMIEGEDSIPPTITASIAPPANADGWHSVNPTVSFVCGDDSSQVATCSDPVTISGEGARQAVTGTATDQAGNSASTTVTVNLDKSEPVLAVTSPASGITINSTQVTVSGQATDAVSSLQVSVNGISASLDAAGQFSRTVNLAEGANAIAVEAVDAADNTTSVNLDVEVVLNRPPTTNDQALAVNEDGSLPILLNATDVDGDPLSYRVVSQPANGILSGAAPNLTYQPAANFNGLDSFSFKASDGQVDSNVAQISIQVNPLNDAPEANDQSLGTDEDQALDIVLSGSDVDGDALDFQVTAQPAYGVLSGTPPNLLYTPNPDFNGADQFAFVANDGLLDSNSATVTIDVNALNDAPVISSTAPLSAEENQLYTYQVIAGDTDGDPLGYSLPVAPAGMSVSSDGLVSWTPLQSDVGPQLVSLRVTDGNGGSAVQSFVLIVEVAPNLPPAFTSTPVTVGRVNDPYQYLLSAQDPDGDSLTFALESGPAGMTLVGAQLEWVPSAGQSGSNAVTVSVSDGNYSPVLQSFSVIVDEMNFAPQITSTAQTAAVEGQDYLYDVTATDANLGDQLAYSLQAAPAGMSIDPDSGVVTWLPPLDAGNGIHSPNTQCAISQDDTVSIDPAVDLIVVMDESGSMLTEQLWSQEFIAPLDAALLARGVGSGSEPNLYGLVGFGKRPPEPRILSINSNLLDEFQHFDVAAEQLVADGQFEDGWAAITFAFEQYPMRANSSKNIILVTDEDRDDLSTQGFPQYALDYSDVLDSLRGNNALLNAVIRVNFLCGDGTPAFGLDSQGNGYFHKGSGNYGLCTDVSYDPSKPPFGDSIAHYADLAWDTGGAVWSLRELRGGGEVAEAFSKALKDTKVREIVTSLPAIEKADLAITSIQFEQADGSLRVELLNRGLIESTPGTLDIYFDSEAPANLLSSVPLAPLAPSDGLVVAVDASAVADSAGAFIARIDGDAENDCGLDNNRFEASLVQLRVTDSGGLFDEQSYIIDIAEVNEAPQITSAPVTRVSVGEIYSYQVEASDPNPGDALAYALIAGAPGMSIDPLSGEIDFKPLAEVNGSYSVTVKVLDLAGLEDIQSFQLEVDTLYQPPVIVSDPIRWGVIETEYRYQPTVQANPGAVLSYEILHSVDGLQIDAASGLITWPVPLDLLRTYVNVAFKVEDQFGNVDSQHYRLHIDEPNAGPTIVSPPITGFPNYGRGQYLYDPEVADPNYYEEHSWNLRSSLTDMSVDRVPLTYIGNRYIGPLDRLTWPAENFHELIHQTQSVTHYQCRAEVGLRSTSAIVDWSADLGRRQFAQPLIAPLADTNGNGQLDASDDSFLIVASLQVYRQSSTPALHALDLRGNLVWEWDVNQLDWYTIPAVADLDGDLSAEIIVKTMSGEILALDNLGQEKWRSAVVSHGNSIYRTRYGAITLADIDADGDSEILVGGSVLDHEGNLLWRITDDDIGTNESQVISLAADLDGDGRMEVLFNNGVYDHLGNLLWRPLDGEGNPTYRIVNHALVNADADDHPEVVVSSLSQHLKNYLSLYDHDGSVIWQIATESSGPPNVADIDGDGVPEIFNPAELAAYDLAGNELWRRTDIGDRSSRGAALADLNQDGAVEVIIYAGSGFRILDAASGTDLSIPYLNQSFSLSQPLVYTNKDDETAILFGGYDEISSLVADTGPWPGAAGNRIYNQFFAAEVSHDRGELGVIDASDKPWLTHNSFQFYGSLPSGADAGYQSDLLPLNAELGYDENGGGNTLTIDILNRGLARADADFNLVMRLNSAAGAEVGRRTVAGLNANVRETLTFNNLGDEILGQVLHLTIEYGAGITECETDNNVMSIAALELTVEDKEGESDRQVFSLTIYDVNQGAEIVYRAPTEATEGEEYRFTFAGQDEDIGDFVVFKPFLPLPQGATLNQMTGEFVWTPPFGSAGTQSISIRVEDLVGQGSQRGYTLVVNPSNEPNTAPTLDAVADQVVKAGETLQLNVNAVDAEGHQLYYTLLQNPSGMILDEDSGLLEWTPSAAQAGDHTVRLSATDIRDAEDSTSFTVTVVENSAPEIAGTAPARATVGVNYVYNLLASDADGDALSYRLISGPTGMSVDGNGLVSWLPDASHLPSQQAVIEVSDGQITLTLTLTIPVVESNTAPFITSPPVTAVTADEAYLYAVQAQDNENDTLSYLLTTAPVGMSIDPVSGVVGWLPGLTDLGTHPVVIEIDDGRGGGAQQSYTLVVNDGVSNLPPEITSLAPQFVVEGELFSYTVVATDPDGDSLTTSVTQAPSGTTLVGDTIEWTPATGGEIPRYEDFRVEVSDGDNTAFQNFFVAVVDENFDPLALVATLSVPRTEYDLDELLAMQVASSGPGPIDQSLTVNGNPVDITDTGEAYYRLDQPGSYRILFTASNGEQTDFAEVFVSVIDPSDISFPVVEIQSPTQQQTITSRIDIVGTAADDNLRFYQLSYQRADAKTATLLPPQTASVTGGVLGSFDATQLLNGVYYIALTAVDINGHQSQETLAVIVDGQIKVGNFSVTLEDLSIPVTGIPVRITRTYDTRRKGELLDFGYGWSIDYQNVQVTETRSPGDAWRLNEYRSGFQNTTINFCVQPLGQPQVVVNLPDGDIETFDVRAEPECQLYIPRIDVQMAFEPTSGTTSALELQRDPTLRLANGNLVEIGESVDVGIDPSLYKLTTKSGMVYLLDQDFGITQVIDINGNTLTYSDDGIVHSSGKSIDFIRDGQGRITQITDPMGQAIIYDYTNAGDLDASTDREANITTYDYDTAHGLTDLFDPLGRPIIKNFYDADGRLEAQEDADGNRTEYVHDLAGRTSEVTDRLGRITQFAYDTRGNVTSEVDALGNLTTYTYDAHDNQTSRTDALGNMSMSTWDDQRNQLSAIDELGRETSYTYNQWGKELRITDAKGRSYNSTYDSVGNLRSINDPQGYTTGSVQLNVKGLITRAWDTYSNITDFTYDDDGNKLTETDPLGNLTTFTYNDNGNALTETVQRTISGLLTDETTTFEYDALDRVIKTTDALGNETEMVYDEVGNRVQDIDALGRVTLYTYDVYRRLTHTDYPDGSFTSMTYDAEGNLLTETDANDNTTGYTYDALNRLTVTTYDDGSTMQTTYDTLGRVLTETDARGNVTTFEYDAAGQRVKTITALAEETTYAYDLNGNLETMTDARGNTWGYEYDVYDNRTVTTWPDLSTSEEVTDRLGRITEKTDQNGNRMTFAYDPLGRLLNVTDALSNVTTYTYDEVGNKLTQTDAEGRTTAWTYDALGRELTRILPLGQVESQQYDAVGNRERVTDFNGQVTTYGYDDMYRLDTVTYNDATFETFNYDDHGNRTAATDRYGASQIWDYDNRHRLILVVDAAGNRIEYDYDDAGNKIEQITTPAGLAPLVTGYGYDALNRLDSVTDVNGLVTTYGYDTNGNRARVTYPNGNETTYGYDDNNRLIRQTTRDSADVLLADYQYTLDPSGHRLQIDEPGRQTTYTYDDSYKLLTEDIIDPVNGDHSAVYEYDKVGNRIYGTINGVQTLYTYDDNDRLLQQGGEVFTHDDNGNTLTKTIDGFQSTYTYDAKNHLESGLLNDAGAITSSTYRYDVDGIRVGKTEGTDSTDYLIDLNRDYAQVIRETDGTGASIDYLYGDDLIQQSQNAANERYFLYDGLGSTRLLTDDLGTITDRYDYEAFGSLIFQDGVAETNYRFTGEQYDEGLDQYYLRARYYDQSIGRFTQMDTWKGDASEPINLHKYLYTHSDPVNNLDPSGNITMTQRVVAAAAFGVLATIANPSIQVGFNPNERVIFNEISTVETGWLKILSMGAPPALAEIILKKEIDEQAAQKAGENRALADAEESVREFNVKRALIGETQSRVDAAAAHYQAITIGFDSPYNYPGNLTSDQVALSMAYNFGWVVTLRAEDFEIFDIGVDKRRIGPVSSWYLIEITAVRGYYKHITVPWD